MASPTKAELAAQVEVLRKSLDLEKAKSALLTEQHAATSEILGLISSSPTDVQPVFEAIIASAVRLCDGFFGIAFRFDGEHLSIAAHHQYSSDAVETISRSYPTPPTRNTMAGRAVLDRAVIHVPDVANDSEVSERSRRLARQLGYRAFLAVPMLREGAPIGVIN